jgi:tetrathionate reductase subunit A
VGEQTRAKYGKLVNLYQESVAKTRNSMTGEYLKGTACYVPIADSLGRELEHLLPASAVGASGHPLRLITHRDMLATKSRTISNYWLTELLPENAVWVNRLDAKRLRLSEGDRVRLVSISNPEGLWRYGPGREKPMEARVRISYHIRPGVVSFELGYGHWAYGSGDQTIDGAVVPGESRRGAGIHANAAMYVDPYLRSPLSDVVGGSVVFYDTMVYLKKV